MSTEIGCDEKENIISNEKPKYTYRELITLALADKTCLTLSNIYSWISKFFPFYSASDEKWKNSIRHNLSLYPEFVKGKRHTMVQDIYGISKKDSEKTICRTV